MLNFSLHYSMCGYCYELLQLINTATTTKLIRLPQQINDRFDINDKAWKFCSGSVLMIKFLSRI